MMRRILIDHPREHRAAKRPGAGVRVALDDAALDDRIGSEAPIDCEMLLLDQALDELARLDERQAQIVELRYFAGMSEQEVAAVLSLSRATVTREWQAARAWLYRRMTATAKGSCATSKMISRTATNLGDPRLVEQVKPSEGIRARAVELVGVRTMSALTITTAKGTPRVMQQPRGTA
jgi:hypothetical protein